MRAHSRGLCVTRRSKRHDSGLQTAFEEKTDFSYGPICPGPFYMVWRPRAGAAGAAGGVGGGEVG
eukprot:2652612-Prymnesium_polylepis.1